MENNKLVFESLDNFLFEEEKGMIGNIIDKTASYIPRAIRFKKAQRTMVSYLNSFYRKSVKLIDKFASSMNVIASKIQHKYEILKQKTAPLIEQSKTEQAAKLYESFKTEVEKYQQSKINELKQGIENVLQSYSASIDKRIDQPGFILNVELSEKGRGELRAKWSAAVAEKKMKVDEKISDLINTPGMAAIDDMVAEMEVFIEEHKYKSMRRQEWGIKPEQNDMVEKLIGILKIYLNKKSSTHDLGFNLKTKYLSNSRHLAEELLKIMQAEPKKYAKELDGIKRVALAENALKNLLMRLKEKLKNVGEQKDPDVLKKRMIGELEVKEQQFEKILDRYKDMITKTDGKITVPLETAKRMIYDLAADGNFYPIIEQILNNEMLSTEDKKDLLQIIRQPIRLLKAVSPDIYEKIENEIGEI